MTISKLISGLGTDDLGALDNHVSILRLIASGMMEGNQEDELELAYALDQIATNMTEVSGAMKDKISALDEILHVSGRRKPEEATE